MSPVFSDLSQAIWEMQEASASDNGDKGIPGYNCFSSSRLCRIISRTRFVLPYFPQEYSPCSQRERRDLAKPSGVRGPVLAPPCIRHSTVAHCRCSYMPFQYPRRCPASGRGIGVTWQIPIFQPPSSKRRFLLSRFSASSSVERLSRPAWLTGPTIA